MSSYTGYCERCSRCGQYTVSSYSNSHTFEWYSRCSFCGEYNSQHIKYDENNKPLLEDVIYPIDGNLVLGVKERVYLNNSFDSDMQINGKMLWEMPITPNMTSMDIDDFLKLHDISGIVDRFLPADITNDYFLTLLNGVGAANRNKMRNVILRTHSEYTEVADIAHNELDLFYLINGKYHPLSQRFDKFQIEKSKCGLKAYLIIKRVAWDIKSSEYYVMIFMCTKRNKRRKRTILYSKNFSTPISISKALCIWHKHVTDDLDINNSYLLMWDFNKEKFDCVKGVMPEPEPEELEEDLYE